MTCCLPANLLFLLPQPRSLKLVAEPRREPARLQHHFSWETDQRGIVRNNSACCPVWWLPSAGGEATPMAVISKTILAQATMR